MEEKKNYTLRPLVSDDVFPMLRIISGIGLKEFGKAFSADDVKAITAAEKGGEKDGKKPDTAAIGIVVAANIADVIFANLGSCKGDIYRLLSNLSGMKVEVIAGLPLPIFMDMVVDTVKKDEFKDFFKAAARLLK